MYDDDWGDEDSYLNYQTRHLPVVLHRRLKMFAASRGISVEKALNVCLEVGLTKMERREGGQG
jgi:plasmid stability protein